jgi:hypothetical protein
MDILSAKVTMSFFPQVIKSVLDGQEQLFVCCLYYHTSFLMPFYQAATAGFFHATRLYERGNCKQQDVFYSGCTS